MKSFFKANRRKKAGRLEGWEARKQGGEKAGRRGSEQARRRGSEEASRLGDRREMPKVRIFGIGTLKLIWHLDFSL
jgi:hypothetical protein